MKTITLSEDVYDKLAELKHEMSTRSFSELLRKILSKDRVELVYRYAGKFKFNKKRMAGIEWGKWG